MSSSWRQAITIRLPVISSQESVLATREWLRLFSVLGAIAADLGVFLTAATIAAYLRHGDVARGNDDVLVVMMWPVYLFASVTYDAYSIDTLKNARRSVIRAGWALATAAAFAFTAAFALRVSESFSRLETAYMLAIAVVGLTLVRLYGSRWLAHTQYAVSLSTFVLGDDTGAAHSALADRVFNVRHLRWMPDSSDPNFLNLVCRTFRHADRVLLVFKHSEERLEWAAFMRLTGINTEVVEPQLANIVPRGIGHWAGAPTLIISRGPLSLAERVVKRTMDLAIVALLAPAAALVVGALALLIRLESPGPSFFVQDRVGRQNGRYRCYKLRTMRVEAADQHGDRSASRDDDRVTRLGRFLRRTSLDEVPQLWNVFRGEMSVVGPRPHALGSTAEGAPFWVAVDGYWTRHAMKPGLTGLAQVRGLRGATLSVGDIERRVSTDLEYVNSWSIWLDFKILLWTPLVLVHRNAF